MRERLREVLQGRDDVVFAYLFGSAARGEMRRDSDVDVAVYLRAGEDAVPAKLSLLSELTGALGRDAVDVSVLNDATPSLWISVLREGVLLLDRVPETRIETEIRVMREYRDFEPRRRVLEEALLRGIRGWAHGP